MSYCRFTDADIYLYSDVAGYINCQVCTLAPLGKTIFTTGGNLLGEDIPCCENCGGNGCEKCMMHGETHLKDAKEALDHVRLHRESGDYVPSYVDERLLEEIAAELQRADRPSEQKCPSCDGKGELSDLYSPLTLSCKLCKGTGISNRSAGG